MRSSAVVWSRFAFRRRWLHAAGALVVASVGATAAFALAWANPAAVTLRSGGGPSIAVAVSLTPASLGAAPATSDSVPAAAFSVPGPERVEGPVVKSGPLDPSIWVSLIATLAAVALMLLGSGLVAFLYQLRQAKLPAEARWVPPGW